MTSTRRRTMLACIGLAATWNLSAALAASALGADYPSRPVRVVVPYPPGGATDILARMVGTKLQEAWGHNVIVENRPGAGGVIGTEAVAKAPADGYTVLLAITAHIQNPALMKLPYDPYKDFTPVSQLSTSTSMLAVPASLPVKTVAEFVALIRSQPGRHSYGSYGNGSSAHIQGANLAQQAGADLVHVPYKGAAPLITDLLGGQLSSAFLDVGSAAKHVSSGGFRVLAVTGTERLKILPDTPTFAELGYRNFEPKGWFGYFVPAGTPAPVVAKLSADIRKAARSPDVVKRIEDLGQTPVGSTPEELAAVMQTDGPLYARMIRDLNIRVD